jgi:hypothetical protein
MLAVVGVLMANQTAPPSEADWQWLEASREQAFDRLLPVIARDGQFVAYRSYRDLYHDVAERYLRIERDSDLPSTGEVLAHLVVPIKISIQQQLLDLHRLRPDADLETLLAGVAVRRVSVRSTGCTPLKKSLDELSGVSLRIPRSDNIILHPTIHRFVIELPTARMDVSLDDNQAPLVRWAAKAIAVVERCAA